MIRVALVAVAVLSTLAPSAAAGTLRSGLATCEVDDCEPPQRVDVRFVAHPGERNGFTVSATPTGVRIEDGGARLTLDGPYCTSISPIKAVCARGPDGISVAARLGDADDVSVIFRSLRVHVHLGSGRDKGLGRSLDGGKGDDLLRGTGARDRLAGGLGDDLVIGGGRRDSVAGGPGRDQLGGGRGPDVIFGGDGRDFLFGGRGDDELHGGPDDDRLRGGPAADLLICGPGRRDSALSDRFDRLFGCEAA
jgi:hypothetical protein